MTDTEQQDLVERFGRLDDPVRVLLCSDVASEGLNLHYFCHRLVHFDLPWSLMVFQQRNGRVDRYGQKHQPQIVYLFTETVNERVKGDWRILEILERKDEQANLNLGDPSAFLNVYDPDKEVEKVSGFMADGLTPEQVEATLDQTAAKLEDNEGDFLMQLFGGGASEPSGHAVDADGQQPQSHRGPGLAVQQRLIIMQKQRSPSSIRGRRLCQWATSDPDEIITITAPRDLQERLRQLPREVQAENDHYSRCGRLDPRGPGDRNRAPGPCRRRHLAAAALPVAAASRSWNGSATASSPISAAIAHHCYIAPVSTQTNRPSS